MDRTLKHLTANCRKMSSLTLILSSLLVLGPTVFGYESVYDIIERRNMGRSYFDEGRYRYPSNFANELHRYHNFDNKPFLFDPYKIGARGTVIFGNGYDNIGNGNIHPEKRLHYFPVEPFPGRIGSRYRNYQIPIFYNDKYHFIEPEIGERYFKIGNGFRSSSSSSSDANEHGRSGILKSENIFANAEGNKERKASDNFGTNRVSLLNKAVETENFDGKFHSDKNGEAKSTLQSNKIRKKGHVTKGFSSHHHKDETGNSTTFYDQSLDHGGQSDFKDIADEYGTKANVDQFGTFRDGKFFIESNGKTQNYGSEFAKDEQKREKDISTEENYGKEENFRIVDGEKWPISIDGNSFPFPIHYQLNF